MSGDMKLEACPFCGGAMQLDCGILSHQDRTEASRRDCPLKGFVAAQCVVPGWRRRALSPTRDDVLEEAAKVAEDHSPAAAFLIRALKGRG